MSGSIYMMIYFSIVAIVGTLYFYIKDLRNKKKHQHSEE